jgi:hypothetical protein
MQTNHSSDTLTVKIVANDRRNPPGKLVDAELHFSDGVLAGLKLIGFSIWERRGASGRNVTFPARQYAINGERRSFALLRPIADASAQERVRCENSGRGRITEKWACRRHRGGLCLGNLGPIYGPVSPQPPRA